MTTAHLVLPALAMMLLTISILFVMGAKRTKAVTSREVSAKFYSLYNEGQEPDHLRVITRHIQNHFEVPPLFYVSVVLLILLNAITSYAVALAWLFVIARYAHTFIHLNGNKLNLRFASWVLSIFALVGLWIVTLISAIGSL